MDPKTGRNRKVAVGVLSAVCVIALAGCALRRPHYQSLLTLRQETAANYSQQVLDAIVGVQESAQLPVFFKVEGGQSSWSPTYGGSAGLNITEIPLRTVGLAGGHSDQETRSFNFQGSEVLSDSIQFNDFGEAAMNRVSMLFGYLCLQADLPGSVLPNGALYATIGESGSSDDFIIWTRTRKGRYIGVTEKNKYEFLMFSRDVMYWAKAYAPDVADLVSPAGILYRFFVEYPRYETQLAQAVIAKSGAEKALSSAKDALEAKENEYESLKQEAKTSNTAAPVLQALLQLEHEELKSQHEKVSSISGQLGESSGRIEQIKRDTEALFNLLHQTLTLIKENDPNADLIHPDKSIEMLRDRIARLSEGDFSVLEETGTILPKGSGIDARESTDQLYRERFEALPQQYDMPGRQGLQ